MSATSYFQSYPNRIHARLQAIDLPGYDELVESFTTGYPLLDPTREATGPRDSKYQLRLNVDPESFRPDDFS